MLTELTSSINVLFYQVDCRVKPKTPKFVLPYEPAYTAHRANLKRRVAVRAEMKARQVKLAQLEAAKSRPSSTLGADKAQRMD
jgi:hypothetical protein